MAQTADATKSSALMLPEEAFAAAAVEKVAPSEKAAGAAGGGNGRRPPFPLGNLPTPSRNGGGSNRADKGSSAGGEKARGPASALEDLMRRKGVDEAWNALEEMQRQGVQTDKFTVSRMLMKTVGDGRTRLNPSRVYRGIALVEKFIELQPKDVDEVLFNALLDTCCRLKDLPRLEATVNRMREIKVSPSPVTLGILVKTYGQAGDLQKVLQVWGEMERQRGQANAVTYGCMIDACVKCGNLEKAVEIFKGMRQAGKHRNTILYTTLIKGYGLDKNLASALELFREMPQEGVPYNTITYNSILDACVKCGDLAQAEGLLREITAPASNLEPDLITFSTLLKGYCHIGDLDKALQVVEAIKARGLRCDELVYNTLMDGCVKANDVAAGVGLFEEMIQNGMRPSTITHSILARLYQRAGYEDDAPEAVAQLYQNHGLERPVGGDRGKGFGRRWNPRNSPGGAGRGGDRNGNRSAQSSPSTASVTSGYGLRRDQSDGGFSDGGWTPTAWGHMPMMPTFGGDAGEPSAPSTPMGSPMGSPAHSGGPFLPVEAMRGMCVPPMPGCAGQDTPNSMASCTPVGSMPPASVNSSPCVAGSAWGASPHFAGLEQQQAMQTAFGHMGSPCAAQAQGQQSLPPWPFTCNNGVYSGGNVPLPPSAPPAEAQMQQLVMMQAPGPAPPMMADGSTPCANGGFGQMGGGELLCVSGPSAVTGSMPPPPPGAPPQTAMLQQTQPQMYSPDVPGWQQCSEAWRQL